MQFKVDDEVVYELSDDQIKILQSNISADVFEEDMRRRVRWVIENKLKNVTKELNDQWLPKLAETNEMLPSDPEQLSKLVLEHPDYKDIKQLSNKS